MRTAILRAGVAASAVFTLVAGAGRPEASESMTVTVKTGVVQTFGGFGMHKGGRRYKEAFRDTINALMIRDLKIAFARFYVQGRTADSILADFDAQYKYPDGTTMFDDFVKQNPRLYFLLAQNNNVDSVSMIAPFCATWAQAAKALGETRRVPISWMGVTSEPNLGNGEFRRIHPRLYTSVVRAMRAAMDAQELTGTKLYIPEISNVDEYGQQYLDSAHDDAATWACVGGLITKGYNMNADLHYLETVEESHLPYFVAAGANLIEGYAVEKTNDDDNWAADMAGRMLSDFNHGVSNWGWYLPAEDWSDREASHRLAFYFEGRDAVTAAGLDPAQCMVLGSDEVYLMLTLKYYYLKHLANTFDVGSQFRFCQSSPARPYEDMWWTYGQKPAITAVASVNPDSTWSIGVANLTGMTSDTLPIDDFFHMDIYYTFYPAADYQVALDVEELAKYDSLRFALYRSNKTKHVAFEDSVTMKSGKCTITLASRELVTLRGAKGKGVVLGTVRDAGPPVPGLRPAPYVRPGVGIVVPLGQAGDFEVLVLTPQGQRVLAANVAARGGPRDYTVPTSAVARGVYLVRVSSPEGVAAYRVVVRQ